MQVRPIWGCIAALTLASGVVYGQDATPKTSSDVEAKLKEKVTVTFADTALHFVLEELQKRTESNIVVTASVDRFSTPVTMQASKLPLGDVLDKLQKKLKLTRSVWSGAIVLHPVGTNAPAAVEPPTRVKGARALRLPVSLQHTRATVRDVVARLEKRTQVPMSIPARVRATLRKHGVRVTLRLYRMPVYEALNHLALQCGLTWNLVNGRVQFALLDSAERKVEVDTLKYDAKEADLKLAGPTVDLDEVVARLGNARSRGTATRELILYGEKAIPKVAALLRRTGDARPDGPTTTAALKVMAEWGKPAEYDAVLKVFKDVERSADVRLHAADTLAAMRAPEAVPALIVALDDQSSLRLAESARRALVAIGKPTIQPLTKAYRAELSSSRKDLRPGVLYRSLLIFGELRQPEATAELLRALQIKKGQRAVSVRHHAAIGLGFTNDPQVIPVLIRSLEQEKDFLISKYIARSLQWITSERLPPDGRPWRAWWENTGKRRYGKTATADEILKRLAGGEIQLDLDKQGFAKINETVEQRITRLLEALGDTDATKVRAATNDLVALKEKALPRLREAAKGKGVKAERAGAIVVQIEESLVE